jgi:hypothetical protein
MDHTADDPIANDAFNAWLKHVKGSWSSSDWKIYLAGYLAGWMERGRQQEVNDGRSTETGS